MKQFGKILKFELKSYLTNKIFVGVTVVLMAAIIVAMFFPRVMELFEAGDESTPAVEDQPVMLIVSPDGAEAEVIRGSFAAAFTDYDVRSFNGDVERQVLSGEAECAFVLDSAVSYTYYVGNLSMYDSNTALADEILLNMFRLGVLMDAGLSYEDAEGVLTMQITHETQTLGKDQARNYFYTYVMIMALYMVIVLYGQMVATNVATEKSSRAMEVLITSADPVSMMFGKVIASCLAGLTQLIAVFGTAFVCFNLNKSYWDADGMMAAVFDMPLELLIYMLVFFVLGFFIYAFLYGAIGSTASKLEDINTSVMPITLLFIVGFFVVVMALAENNVDTVLMKVCSFVPFTSPMAMFTRIAMSTVPVWEIGASIAILIASAVGVGILSAKIYRVGVLLYGTTPKIGEILKAVRKA